jgi:hypothetical protein
MKEKVKEKMSTEKEAKLKALTIDATIKPTVKEQ